MPSDQLRSDLAPTPRQRKKDTCVIYRMPSRQDIQHRSSWQRSPPHSSGCTGPRAGQQCTSPHRAHSTLHTPVHPRPFPASSASAARAPLTHMGVGDGGGDWALGGHEGHALEDGVAACFGCTQVGLIGLVGSEFGESSRPGAIGPHPRGASRGRQHALLHTRTHARAPNPTQAKANNPTRNRATPAHSRPSSGPAAAAPGSSSWG
jgi:hypothetical protein